MKILKIFLVSLFISSSTYAQPHTVEEMADTLLDRFKSNHSYTFLEYMDLAYRHGLVNSVTGLRRHDEGHTFVQKVTLIFAKTLMNMIGEEFIRTSMRDTLPYVSCEKFASHIVSTLIFFENPQVNFMKSILYLATYGKDDVINCFFKK